MALVYQRKCYSSKRNCRALAAACCRFSLILPFLYFFFPWKIQHFQKCSFCFSDVVLNVQKTPHLLLPFFWVFLANNSFILFTPSCSSWPFLSLMLCSPVWLALITFSPSFFPASTCLFISNLCFLLLHLSLVHWQIFLVSKSVAWWFSCGSVI